MPHILVAIEYDKHGNIMAHHWIDDTIGPHNEIQHPDGSGKTIPHHEFLAMCNNDKELREKAGYHVVTKLPGEDTGKSIWQRLVAACNHDEAPEHLKGLKLKE